ncbi:hypothetical protein Agub_g14336, partial [Astrephomene gubernaculifera]
LAHWRPILSHMRQAVWTAMSDPESSRTAFAISLLIMCSILLSTLAFCLDTVPAYSRERHPAASRVFRVVEAVTVQVFAADYLVRLLTCPRRLPFLVSPLNVVDLVSVAPWYIQTGLQDSGMEGTTVFRVLRLLRVFRVLKLGARYRKLMVVWAALSQSLDVLVLMAFLVAIIVVGAASLAYWAERGTYDESAQAWVRYVGPEGEAVVSPFESIPAGFWWAMVSLMTVGYGDVVPLTLGGRLVGMATMLCGLLAIALPVAVMGTNFSAEWAAYSRKNRAKRRQQQQRRQAAATSSAASLLLLGLSGTGSGGSNSGGGGGSSAASTSGGAAAGYSFAKALAAAAAARRAGLLNRTSNISSNVSGGSGGYGGGSDDRSVRSGFGLGSGFSGGLVGGNTHTARFAALLAVGGGVLPPSSAAGAVAAAAAAGTSPRVEELGEVLAAHCLTVADVQEMMQESLTKLTTLRSEWREASELRHAELAAVLARYAAAAAVQQQREQEEREQERREQQQQGRHGGGHGHGHHGEEGRGRSWLGRLVTRGRREGSSSSSSSSSTDSEEGKGGRKDGSRRRRRSSSSSSSGDSNNGGQHQHQSWLERLVSRRQGSSSSSSSSSSGRSSGGEANRRQQPQRGQGQQEEPQFWLGQFVSKRQREAPAAAAAQPPQQQE